MLRQAQAAVRAFHDRSDSPIADSPQRLDDSRKLVRYKWMKEELLEYYDAENLVDELDALVDLLYFALGTFVEMGVDADSVFQIVHTANLRKFSYHGKILKREDTKVLKPEAWLSPEPMIARYIEWDKSLSGTLPQTFLCKDCHAELWKWEYIMNGNYCDKCDSYVGKD